MVVEDSMYFASIKNVSILFAGVERCIYHLLNWGVYTPWFLSSDGAKLIESSVLQASFVYLWVLNSLSLTEP